MNVQKPAAMPVWPPFAVPGPLGEMWLRASHSQPANTEQRFGLIDVPHHADVAGHKDDDVLDIIGR